VHIRLIAIGDRQPSWVDSAFAEYAGRLPRQWQFRLQEIAAAQRNKGAVKNAAKDAEGAKILAQTKAAELVIVLDERGRQFTSRELATKIDDWQTVGQDIIFVIGGPDGVAADVLQRANLTWSLSKLTLPHGLARVLFAEQIYRAWSLLTGHPYHRD
jgi:23S rRNA (pseudouridine1915-N3)-methyltransferase